MPLTKTSVNNKSDRKDLQRNVEFMQCSGTAMAITIGGHETGSKRDPRRCLPGTIVTSSDDVVVQRLSTSSRSAGGASADRLRGTYRWIPFVAHDRKRPLASLRCIHVGDKSRVRSAN